MKFFKSLLVAPAVIGFITPLSANPTNLNLNDSSIYAQESNIPSFDSIYSSDWSFKAITDLATSRGCLGSIPNGNISRLEAASILNSCLSNVAQLSEIEERLIEEFNPELALIKSSVDRIETRMNEFEAGVFSPTTSASFSVDMAIGAVENLTDDPSTNLVDEDQEKVGFDYGYQIDLTTSFTGEDSLDVSIDAGQGKLSELDLNSGGNNLVVDGIAYTFPLGDKTTVFFGNSMDGSTLFNTACVYGGPTNTLDDCGNLNSALAVGLGTAAGASYDFGNGLTAAIGYEGEGATTSGLGTKEGKDAIAGQIAYTTDSYGISFTLAEIETSATDDDTFTALNAYYALGDGLPSISVGYEWGDDGSAAATADETSHYFIGVQWEEIGDGTLGIAAGTQTPIIEDGDELMMYEAWYSYPINDGMTITPLVFTKDQASGDDHTGLMVKTSFSF